jgi:hypothetical protein
MKITVVLALCLAAIAVPARASPPCREADCAMHCGEALITAYTDKSGPKPKLVYVQFLANGKEKRLSPRLFRWEQKPPPAFPGEAMVFYKGKPCD